MLNNRTLWHFLYTSFCIALAYCIFGYFGTLLTSPPSNASPIWPASGLTLASVMVYGKRILPGLFIGALTIHIYSFLDFSIDESLATSLFTGSITSIASTTQAWTGATLIHHYLGKNNGLLEDTSIFRFFFLSILSCIIAPTVGVFVIYLQGLITLEDLLISWCTWWIGDSIGVVIFTPIILSFIGTKKSIWRLRQKAVALPLLLMLTIIIAIFQYNQYQETNRINAIFQRQVSSLHTALERKIQQHFDLSLILKSFFDSSLLVTNAEFSTLTTPILEKHPSINAVSWAPLIFQSQREQYEKTTTIKEFDHNKNLISAHQRSEYFPIKYIQPIQQNQHVLGFDISTNPIALKAQKKARVTGKLTLTEAIHLAQYPEKRASFVLYSPVYKKHIQLDTSRLSHRALMGFTTTAFNILDELKVAYSAAPDIQLLISIKDNNNIFYTNIEKNQTTPLNLLPLKSTQTIAIADRIWTLSYRPSSKFYHSQLSWTIWWILLGGLFITSLSSIALLMLTGRTLRTEDLIRSRTRALAESEEHFRELVQAQSAIVWRGNPATFEFTFVSDEAEKILGYPIKDWIGNPKFWISHMHEDDKKWAPDFCIESTEALKDHQFEYRMFAKDGHVIWLRDVVKVISEAGKAKEVVGVMLDITKSKNAEETLILNESKYRTLFEDTVEALVVLDLNTLHFTEINDNALALYGLDRETFHTFGPIETSPLTQPNGVSSKSLVKQELSNVINSGKALFEWTHFNKQGQTILCEIKMALLPSISNRHLIASIRDITEQKKHEQEIYDLAFKDPLTGLANRRLFLNHLNKELPSALRSSLFGAAIFLDLDRFKVLNDSLGHHVGDELLIQVAERIKNTLREEDLAARFGGDEFVIMLKPHDENLEQATNHALIVAEKIREVIEQPYLMGSYEHHCTSSIGISLFPEPNNSAMEVMQQADKAMYRSKAKGRNTISFFDPSLQKAADKKLFIEKEIRLALKNQDFALYYQPQLDKSGITISSEALLRWLHPKKGLISPIDFIPIAEESGLIIPLGLWILNQACQQMRLWLNEGLSIHHIAINVSSKQFRQSAFVNQVEHAINVNKLHGSQLYIELTEGIVIDNIDDTIKKMQALKELGVKISIDDFGTGYSSLTYLKLLPLDQLKIDQSFVRDITTDDNDATIVSTIINMAHNLKLGVIAEGVETAKQKEFLIAQGCFVFQGYYYSKPLPVTEFKEFIRSNPEQ